MNDNKWIKVTIEILQEIIHSTPLFSSQYVSSARIICEAIDWYLNEQDKDIWRYIHSINFSLSVVIEQLKMNDKTKYNNAEIEKIKKDVLLIQQYVNKFIAQSTIEDNKNFWQNTLILLNEISEIIQNKWQQTSIENN